MPIKSYKKKLKLRYCKCVHFSKARRLLLKCDYFLDSNHLFTSIHPIYRLPTRVSFRYYISTEQKVAKHILRQFVRYSKDVEIFPTKYCMLLLKIYELKTAELQQKISTLKSEILALLKVQAHHYQVQRYEDLEGKMSKAVFEEV